MCGIAGVINFFDSPSGDIDRMVNLIKHRGPDSQKVVKIENVKFGHARLRILDLNSEADQPFYSSDKSIVLVFNGEIFNYKELKEELHDYSFITQCDSEVIVASYLKWGKACLHKFVGMFGFVLYDLKKKEAFGARDRFGIKPFFYNYNNNQFSFSSEIKGLAPVLGKFEPNYDIITDYLYGINFESKEDTFFKDVKQLLPGECFTFDEKGLNNEFYYLLKDNLESDNSISICNARSGLNFFLNQSVYRRVQSDVPVGLYYSGGVDSTAIGIVIKKAAPKNNIKSYTAVSKNVPKEQRTVIKNMSSDIGIDNKLVFDSEDEDVEALLKRTMWHMETPFSSSVVLDNLLNREAKNDGITVAIEGQGADESQTGYKHYYAPYIVDCVKKMQWQGALSGILASSKIKNQNIKSFFRELYRYSSVYSLIRGIVRPPMHRMLDSNMQKIYIQKKDKGRVKKIHKSHLRTSQYHDFQSKLLRVLRVKDRVSMSYGIELRVPFLDHEFVNYMFKVPDAYKINKGKQKKLLIESLSDTLPKDTHMILKNELLKNKLNSQVRKKIVQKSIAILNTKKAKDRGLFSDIAYISVEKLDKPSLPYLWKLSQVELWHQMFIDGEGQSHLANK